MEGPGTSQPSHGAQRAWTRELGHGHPSQHLTEEQVKNEHLLQIHLPHSINCSLLHSTDIQNFFRNHYPESFFLKLSFFIDTLFKKGEHTRIIKYFHQDWQLRAHCFLFRGAIVLNLIFQAVPGNENECSYIFLKKNTHWGLGAGDCSTLDKVDNAGFRISTTL